MVYKCNLQPILLSLYDTDTYFVNINGSWQPFWNEKAFLVVDTSPI